MSRQQDLTDDIRRSMHDKLIAELRLRQRNIVFPDTVRNWGIFLRNLASKSIYAYTSHRLFALFFGFYYLWDRLILPMIFIRAASRWQNLSWFADLGPMVLSTPWIAVAIKIGVNAIVPDDRSKLRLAKTYPHVKI